MNILQMDTPHTISVGLSWQKSEWEWEWKVKGIALFALNVPLYT